MPISSTQATVDSLNAQNVFNCLITVDDSLEFAYTYPCFQVDFECLVFSLIALHRLLPVPHRLVAHYVRAKVVVTIEKSSAQLLRLLARVKTVKISHLESIFFWK